MSIERCHTSLKELQSDALGLKAASFSVSQPWLNRDSDADQGLFAEGGDWKRSLYVHHLPVVV